MMAEWTAAGVERDVSSGAASVVTALEQLRRDIDVLVAKADALIDADRGGRDWKDVLLDEPAPQLATMLSEHADAISRASSQLRRAEVAALYERGVTMARIAELLDVSRQRVAVILKATVNGEEAAPG